MSHILLIVSFWVHTNERKRSEKKGEVEEDEEQR
jgi:hypothetical protein